MKGFMQSTLGLFFGQTLGSVDPSLIFGLSLVMPAVAMFVLVFGTRQLLRARWRGYWDVV
jgi:hypothetical protein